MIKPRFKLDEYELLRRRMLRETEAVLLAGLSEPDQTVRIPTVEVGKGQFTRVFAAGFWHQHLGITYPEYMSQAQLEQWSAFPELLKYHQDRLQRLRTPSSG
ncbi:MAG TPA: hypothetical protein PKK06_10890 [Phycisphaerae bacterium]|nr:hypothetical protein [Phycisphaerae bacterium]HNU44321.1 hypothetical protein [Phycisphaerae bacterium]